MKKYLHLKFYCLLSLLLLGQWPSAQDFEIQKFDLGEMLDEPTSATFAEEGNDILWLHYTTTEMGSINDKLLKYENENWELVEFVDCTTCINEIQEGPDGILYLAAGELGVYKRESGAFEQFLGTEALAIEWKSDGDMIIVNQDGLHYYDGNEVVEGNNSNFPEFSKIVDFKANLTGDAYLIVSSKLFFYSDTGWVQKTELSAPMSLALDSENRMWVTDNFGEIGYYIEGDYYGGIYDNFGTNDLAIDLFDVLWYADSELTRNENGTELHIEANDLIEGALFISSVYASSDSKIWVAANFESEIARVEFLGNPTATDELNNIAYFTIAPNPATDRTAIYFDLKNDQNIDLIVYSLNGQVMAESSQFLSAGSHSKEIDISNYPTGIYFVHLTLGDKVRIKKLVKR